MQNRVLLFDCRKNDSSLLKSFGIKIHEICPSNCNKGQDYWSAAQQNPIVIFCIAIAWNTPLKWNASRKPISCVSPSWSHCQQVQLMFSYFVTLMSVKRLLLLLSQTVLNAPNILPVQLEAMKSMTSVLQSIFLVICAIVETYGH
jgi:hypothetical protein